MKKDPIKRRQPGKNLRLGGQYFDETRKGNALDLVYLMDIGWMNGRQLIERVS